jgi:hypothetical protein
MWTEFLQGPVVGVCERGDGHFGFTNCGEFLDQLGDH